MIIVDNDYNSHYYHYCHQLTGTQLAEEAVGLQEVGAVQLQGLIISMVVIRLFRLIRII